MGSSQNFGYFFRGPNNRDSSILGIGAPLFWEANIYSVIRIMEKKMETATV